MIELEREIEMTWGDGVVIETNVERRGHGEHARLHWDRKFVNSGKSETETAYHSVRLDILDLTGKLTRFGAVQN